MEIWDDTFGPFFLLFLFDKKGNLQCLLNIKVASFIFMKRNLFKSLMVNT